MSHKEFLVLYKRGWASVQLYQSGIKSNIQGYEIINRIG
jgi:hypothetical protein